MSNIIKSSAFDLPCNKCCDNLYLTNYKFISLTEKDKKTEKVNKIQFDSEKNEEIKNLLNQIKNREKYFKQQYTNLTKLDFTTKSRLMLGIGGSAPIDTRLIVTMHQTYGVPYIPATAIKGCLKKYINCENVDSLSACKIDELFGTENGNADASSGKLIFFDTFPTKFELELDAMTPHNTTFDKGMELNKKIPISILCVAKQSTFPIFIACTDEGLWNDIKKPLSEALKKSLSEYGLGGKTSLGYGRLI